MPQKAANTQKHSCRSTSRYTRSLLCGGLFSLEILEQRPGIIIARATGENAELIFRDEFGGHRWQEISPTDKHKRIHTSTTTVAVLPEPNETQLVIRPQDLEIGTCRAGGNGGQGVNTTDSAVQVKHKPSGLIVRSETERSQTQNKANAIALLRARLWEAERDKVTSDRARDRKQQVGVGARGDKRRTLRAQDDQVVDHITGRRWKLKDYLRGDWD